MALPASRRPARRARLAKTHRKPKSAQASALTNGRLLPRAAVGGVDGRSTWCRRVRDLVGQHIADLGGADNCSSSEIALVRRCAVLVTECERREVGFAADGHVDDEALAVYQTTVNTLRRTLESLGLRRRQRPVPTLKQFLDNWNTEQIQTDDDAAVTGANDEAAR